MIEIAICLAIIGFALVAIIGVLPLGMHTQRDVRQETIIAQDATVLLEAIRTAARGADNLTNSVYAITNYITQYDNKGNVVGANPHVGGYTYSASSYDNVPINLYLTNGANIIGLLSTPQFTDGTKPIPSLVFNGGYSNHVTAYVRSISGLAAEKPPQDNTIMVGDTFTYHVYCVNAAVAADTNLFNFNPVWQAKPYNKNDQVFFDFNYWRAIANTASPDVPGQSLNWVKVPFYPLELAANMHELRLSFLWPQLPNGNLPANPMRQTFRVSVAGQLAPDPNNGALYYYQPQSFSTAP